RLAFAHSRETITPWMRSIWGFSTAHLCHRFHCCLPQFFGRAKTAHLHQSDFSLMVVPIVPALWLAKPLPIFQNSWPHGSQIACVSMSWSPVGTLLLLASLFTCMKSSTKFSNILFLLRFSDGKVL